MTQHPFVVIESGQETVLELIKSGAVQSKQMVAVCVLFEHPARSLVLRAEGHPYVEVGKVPLYRRIDRKVIRLLDPGQVL